jgi:tRNA threonylcarbamoyl adenosine modification protein YeaZ
VLLAFDTATSLTTVALLRDGVVTAERSHNDPRAHTEYLAPFIEAVVSEADSDLGELHGIAVGVGPGAFTGLRVGLVTATTLGMSLGIPVHGVVTLDVLAYEADFNEPFVVVSDARRREVFWAKYDAVGLRTDGPYVGKPDVVAPLVAGLPCVGAADLDCADLFDDIRGPSLPSAAALAQLVDATLGRGGHLLPPEPVYLRTPDVTMSGVPTAAGPASRELG